MRRGTTMRFVHIYLLLFLSGLLFSQPVRAEGDQSPLCGLPANAESIEQVFSNLLGAWQMEHLSGYAVSPTHVFPFGASPDGPETIMLVRENNDMLMTHPMAPAPVVFKRPSEGEWVFLEEDTDSRLPSPSLTSDDLRFISDCNNADMPRLIGRASITLNGVAMDFTYRLIVTGLTDVWDTGFYSGQMYGVMHLKAVTRGVPMTMRRTVVLTR